MEKRTGVTDASVLCDSPVVPVRPAGVAGVLHSQAFAGIVTGLVVGVVTVILSTSFAALIFSGPLAANVGVGISISLLTAAIVGPVVAVMSSWPGMVAIPQDRTAPILGLIAATIAAAVPPTAGVDEQLATVIAALAVAAVITGLALTVLGLFRLGGLIRFIPYPVVGGFLAGSGWLLVRGSFTVMTGTPLSFLHIASLFESNAYSHWLPGVLFAVALKAGVRRSSHSLVMPAMLIGAVAVFYLVLLLSGTAVEDARGQGWMLGVLPSGHLRELTPLTAFAHAHWGVIFGQIGSLSTIVMVSAVSIMLSVTALEVAADHDIDANRELQAAGVANLAAGVVGGMVGFQSLSLSSLPTKLGVRNRLIGVVSGAVCAATLLGGVGVASYLPKPVLGGVLFFVGLLFLVEWVYEGWFRLSKPDYVVMIVILGVIGTVDYIPGIGVGIIAAVIMFVVNYSRVDVVKHVLSGADHCSNVERPLPQQRLLREHGEQVYILQLQGFIFFGTAHNLLTQVLHRVESRQQPRLRFLVLDFRRVSGLDSSAVLSFVRMRRLAQRFGFAVVVTQVPLAVHHQLTVSNLVDGSPGTFRVFADLDHGLEWCEDSILDAAHASVERERWTLADLQPLGADAACVNQIAGYLERIQLTNGQHIIHQGDAGTDLYFIESGHVTVRIELDDGRAVRLRTMGAGTVVGEMGLYLQQVRSASVVADEPTVVHRLSAEALERMERENPDGAAALHRLMAHLLAERLANTNKTLQALLE